MVMIVLCCDTERAGHAHELVKDLVLTEWYGIVIVSGDGLIFEVCFCYWVFVCPLLVCRPGRGAKYCKKSYAMSVSVVCRPRFVCTLTYLKKDMSKLHKIFCTCCLM